MGKKLTKTVVEAMRPGDTLWDGELRGFGVRLQADTASYFVKTRIKGRQRWTNIGKHGSPWTVETARREALRIRAAAADGVDIGSERMVERRSATVQEVAKQFMAQHGPKLKPRTRDHYSQVISRFILPAIGTRKAADIVKADVSRLHSKLADTPRQANLTLSILSKLMSWAIDHGFRPDDQPHPCKRITRYRETSRERYLAASEMGRLFEVLDGLDRTGAEVPHVTAAIRLLLLTGARLSEITTLKWEWVDLERATLWLPDSKTGKKAIRLNGQAVQILRLLPRMDGNPHVIVGNKDGAFLINLQKPWRRIRKLAGLDDVRIHDLRHSFASVAINAGASLAMVGKLLGHAQPQTTARYAHLADDPLRLLNDQIGNAIASAGTAKPDGEAA